jgi:hypothetical protein
LTAYAQPTDLKKKLTESLEQETATSEVLRVISKSLGSLSRYSNHCRSNRKRRALVAPSIQAKLLTPSPPGEEDQRKSFLFDAQL